MPPIKNFIKPNKRKVLLFAIFILIAFGGRIQASLRRLECNLLEFLPFLEMWMTLELPFIIPFLLIEGLISEVIYKTTGKIIILGDLTSPFFIIFEGFYLYLLACLAVLSFEYYGRKFPKLVWLIITIISFPIALLGAVQRSLRFEACLRFSTHFTPALLPSFFGIFLIVFLYIYLLFCLIVFICNKLIKRKLKRSESNF